MNECIVISVCKRLSVGNNGINIQLEKIKSNIIYVVQLRHHSEGSISSYGLRSIINRINADGIMVDGNGIADQRQAAT